MAHIFLSASVPLPDRDSRFFESADVLLIREAIKCLVETVLPTGSITCGGHPTITPLLAFFAESARLDRDRLTIFQARHFEANFPEEIASFHNVVLIDDHGMDAEANLLAMRAQMIGSRQFDAGVFIGGMEGVVAEERMFREAHPNARVLPVASTGAAAQELFNQREYPEDFSTELTYSTLFRRHLIRRETLHGQG